MRVLNAEYRRAFPIADTHKPPVRGSQEMQHPEDRATLTEWGTLHRED